MKDKLTALLLAIMATFAISCAGDGVSKVETPAQPTTTPIPFPSEPILDEVRNGVVNEALRFAADGCPSINERLSGFPTRILSALTNSVIASGLINPEADFEFGPGGGGAVTVWVVAIEGQSVPISNESAKGNGSNARSFVFVIRDGDPEITGCVTKDAPIPIEHTSFYGSFEFDVLLDAS